MSRDNIFRKLGHQSLIHGNFLCPYLLYYYQHHLEKCIDYGDEKRIIIHLGLNEIDSPLLHSFYGYGMLSFDSNYNYLYGYICIREYYVTEANIDNFLSLPSMEVQFIIERAKSLEFTMDSFWSVQEVGNVTSCNHKEWILNHEFYYYHFNPDLWREHDYNSEYFSIVDCYNVFDLEYSLTDYGFYEVSLHSDDFYINHYKNHFYPCFSFMYSPINSSISFRKFVA